MGRPVGSKNKPKQAVVRPVQIEEVPQEQQGFRVIVDVKKDGKRFDLEFGMDRRHSALITLAIPDSKNSVVIRPDEGRKFGDNNDDGTPCTVSVGKMQIPAIYIDNGNFAAITQ